MFHPRIPHPEAKVRTVSLVHSLQVALHWQMTNTLLQVQPGQQHWCLELWELLLLLVLLLLQELQLL